MWYWYEGPLYMIVLNVLFHNLMPKKYLQAMNDYGFKIGLIFGTLIEPLVSLAVRLGDGLESILKQKENDDV